ncbi:RNA polymerase sigma factor [Butyrivibrio sp. AE2005]|uniref:RNA polymerase sigma factor n=1 Tax=Butyrivibrio sp. AE2005 TaxID=1496722 RepID=UPI000690BD9C|nr:RNA polymerase sigma factor [Butyrivibrio sp. AE2005]
MGKIDSREKLIQLMDRYKNLVFSVCLKLTGDHFTAEDITQETFISAYRHLEDFDGCDEKAWICRIASNKCIDYLRSSKMREVASTDDELEASMDAGRDGPLETYIARDVEKRFFERCNELDEPYRSAAVGHFIQGKTAKEISLEKGIPLKTTQSHIYRAREMLKKIIRKEELLT